jgi:hypothetical protein
MNSVKYLCEIFDRKITWRTHTKTIAFKAFRKFIRIYSLLKSERLSANTKLTLYKAFIRSITTCACPAWEFAADSHLLKWQCLQNKVPRTVGNLSRRTPTSDLHKH